MAWLVVALSLGFVTGSFALAILWKRRARRVRIVSRGSAVQAPSGVYGLDTADLRALRNAARSRRAGWSRDYAMDDSTGMPGRVGGIPRSLRVKS
jgi:hypothetical protein